MWGFLTAPHKLPKPPSEVVCRLLQCHGRASGVSHNPSYNVVMTVMTSAVLSTPAQAAAAKHRVVHTAAVEDTAQ